MTETDKLLFVETDVMKNFESIEDIEDVENLGNQTDGASYVAKSLFQKSRCVRVRICN